MSLSFQDVIHRFIPWKKTKKAPELKASKVYEHINKP